jgi:hypothetical protein
MEEPQEGTTVTFERSFTVAEVQQFADLSGDIQPRHTEPDDDGRVMVQGLLTATMPTKLGGDREVMAPKMEFEFLQPVYTGESAPVTQPTTGLTNGMTATTSPGMLYAKTKMEMPCWTRRLKASSGKTPEHVSDRQID